MKFTNGRWLVRDGYRVHYARRAHEVTTGERSFTVLVPTRRIEHRGHMLEGPVITVTCAAIMPDVVAVTVVHLAGETASHPTFAVSSDAAADVSVDVDERAVRLTSGRLTARAALDDEWRLEFVADDRVLTVSDTKGMGLIDAPDGRHYVQDRLLLGVDTHVYGLGERFGAFVKNGQVVEVWNEDAGTCTEQAYKNVPFYLTDAGYGVFVDDPGLVSFEVGSEVVSKVQFSVEAQSLRYFVIYGPTPKEILRKYTALTGRPALPPAWSFGLWLSTSFTTAYDEETVTSFVQGMAERDIPLSVFHFDCFWMRAFRWCDFEWDPSVFPDPVGMLRRLEERGLRVCVWINPYIAQASPLFAEGRDGGYLLERPDGSVWQTDTWQPGMAIVDFTNPDAREWYRGHLSRLLDMGVDCFKTDFGERIPTDVVWHDGSDPERMHNYYSYLYNEAVFELLRSRHGDGAAVLFARSATAGSQRFPVHWGGDPDSTFTSMAETLRGGLSLAVCGFGFWSHDIGGFEGDPSPAVFKRWIPFGLLSSHSRLHGRNSYRVPWLFDDEAVDVLRDFTRLKLRLMPYLYAAAVEAHESGLPVMRPMLLEFPDDPAAAYVDRQYMLGRDLLVAPVFSADGEVTYYVPPGTWTHLISGVQVQGPAWLAERHDFHSLPLLVRPGAVLPIGARDDRPDYDFADGVTLRAYDLGDDASVTTVIPTPTGAPRSTYVASRRGQEIRVDADAPPGSWQLELVGVASVGSIEGGTSERVDGGTLIRVAPGAAAVLVRL